MIDGTSQLYKAFPWMADYPNMALYILQFGHEDLIPIPWVAKDLKSAEKIYERCVSQGETWRKVLNIAEGGEV